MKIIAFSLGTGYLVFVSWLILVFINDTHQVVFYPDVTMVRPMQCVFVISIYKILETTINERLTGSRDTDKCSRLSKTCCPS